MPLTSSAGTPSVTLDPGFSIVLANGITAAQAAPGAPVLATNQVFSVQPLANGGNRTLNLKAKGIAGVPTLVTAQIWSSDDAGVSWQEYQQPIQMFSGGVAQDAQAVSLVAGLTYQFTLSALTLGATATAVNIDGQVS